MTLTSRQDDTGKTLMRHVHIRTGRVMSTMRVMILCATGVSTVMAQRQTTYGNVVPVPLALYRFHGSATNEGTGPATLELKNTAFREGALYLNGTYDGKEGGYRAICKTPTFDYNAFTVALRFKAQDFSTNNYSLLVGGERYRWFSLAWDRFTGNLLVCLNQGGFGRSIAEIPLKQGEWTTIAVGVDIRARIVRIYQYGYKATEFQLPADFKLDVVGTKAEIDDKAWCFTDYSTDKGLFHGLVEELIIYDRLLTGEQLAAIPIGATPLTIDINGMPDGQKH